MAAMSPARVWHRHFFRISGPVMYLLTLIIPGTSVASADDSRESVESVNSLAADELSGNTGSPEGRDASEISKTLSLLDASDPWYPQTGSPALTTSQWLGDDDVDAVIVLAIDDMRDPAKYEQYLRPILNRLKRIDGRAPVSIMTCDIRPDDPQLQSWLGEGLSIECHTVDHPCPLLRMNDLPTARSTYDRCVDLMHMIPGNHPVAFRMPCCDSLNTVSPRFYSQIFSQQTDASRFLQIDSSVFVYFTSEDPSLPRDIVLDEAGNERFLKYRPRGNKYGGNTHDHFVNYIVNYPYPYVINGDCWEIPCIAPSDWSAQHLHGINNPQTVADWKRAVDLTVLKKGCFSLVFHPHGWISAEQVIELIDHAENTYGSRVRFLTFRECAERLNNTFSQGKPLRTAGAAPSALPMAGGQRYSHLPREVVNLIESSSHPQFQPIIRSDGSENGFFIDDRHFCWINEDTSHLPDLMHRVSMDAVLADYRQRQEKLSQPAVLIGAAVIDVTPDFPVRLTGYGNRRVESEGIAARIHARSLAIGEGSELAVLVTVDNCGIPIELTEKIFDRVTSRHGISRERFAVAATHSHSAPWLRGFAPNIFPEIPEDHAARLAMYESQLTDQIVEVVDLAVAARRPGYLSLGYGETGFAMNRRTLVNGRWTGFGETPDGPTDKRVPVLAAHDPSGRLIAVLANYACHCTTETGEFNQISGDWAGFAADLLEAEHPGAVALIAIGCGADANPSPRGTHEQAKVHGRTLADEVNLILATASTSVAVPHHKDAPDGTYLSRLVRKPLQRIDAGLLCRMLRISLPHASLPSRSELEEQARDSGVAGSRARYFLQRLDDGIELPAHVDDYPVQTWCFGNDLAMVFLGGEVVVDYSIRMNDMFDSDRLWINAYSNDVPCYIPSARLLREGGYECDSSMLYYRRPTRLAPETEDLICDTVQKLLPHEFYSPALQQDFPAPKTPDESLQCMTTRSDLKVVLAASEPLIRDPVAFDWDTDGRLWVVEMGDYPSAQDSRGRVRILYDRNGDGVYDDAVTFIDQLAFPTGIHCWRGGAIITMAPEIFYAEDSDGDGVADLRQTLYKGFTEGNQQHRVNGLRWGLDGWLYVANGDSGGEIIPTQQRPGILSTGKVAEGPRVALRGRDLRIQPDTNELDPVSGQSQFGRERDDFGNWFGNNNSNPIWHYRIEDHHARRNPFAAIGSVTSPVAAVSGAAPVFPASRTLARFNDFGFANRFTSACGTMIYRDNLLGDQYYGNAFTSEPVHNLVSRLVLERRGYSFHGVRASDEQQSEFLASSDNWFRPTMIRTGPDGALWIADMYRAVIEHPEWIPDTYQRKMDLFAGNDRGRIYRILPASQECCGSESASESGADLAGGDGSSQSDVHRRWFSEPWDKIPLSALTERLCSINGWWRDTAHRILMHRQNELLKDQNIIVSLTAISSQSKNLPTGHSESGPLTAAAKVQAAALLSNLALATDVSVSDVSVSPGTETPEKLSDDAQTSLITAANVWSSLTSLIKDPNPRVRQSALRIAETVAVKMTPSDSDIEIFQQLVRDEDSGVRHQLALFAGILPPDHSSSLLSELLLQEPEDSAIRSAVLTSLSPDNIDAVIRSVTERTDVGKNVSLRNSMATAVDVLLGQAAAMGQPAAVIEGLERIIDSARNELSVKSCEQVTQILRRFNREMRKQLESGPVGHSVHSLRSLVAEQLEMSLTSTDGSAERQVALLRLLHVLRDFAGRDSVDALQFLTPRYPPDVQMAAVSLISRNDDLSATERFFSHWSGLPPAVRHEAISLLLSRDATVIPLLDAIEQGKVAAVDLDAVYRDRLVFHQNVQIASRASRLLTQSDSSGRDAIVEDFKTRLSGLTADATAGRAVFEKRCAVCHRLRQLGREIGADLASLKDRSTDSLLTAILDPNRAVETKFLVYNIVTEEGLTYSGMLKSETGGSLTLLTSEGREVIIPRAEIEEVQGTRRSLMPDGLERDLSPQDMADVIAFVQSAAGGSKQFDGNRPGVLVADEDGTILLPASAAEIFGPSLVFESQYGNLGFWTSTEDYATWTFDVPRSGHWTVVLDLACDDSTAGGIIRFSTGNRLLSARVPGTGSWDNYRLWQAGTIDLHRGRCQLTLTAADTPIVALADIRAVRLIPPSR